MGPKNIEALAAEARSKLAASTEKLNLSRISKFSESIFETMFNPETPDAHPKHIHGTSFMVADIPIKLEAHKDLDIVISLGHGTHTDAAFIGVYFFEKGEDKVLLSQMSYILHIRSLDVADAHGHFTTIYAVHESFSDHLDVIYDYLQALEIGRVQKDMHNTSA